MGKKSRVLFWQRKRLQFFIGKRKRMLKKGPWICPWCFNQSMRYKIRGKGLLIFYCSACKLGECLPKNPYKDVIDMYCAIVDNTINGTIPTWRFQYLTEERRKFLEKYVTLGKIELIGEVNESGNTHVED